MTSEKTTQWSFGNQTGPSDHWNPDASFSIEVPGAMSESNFGLLRRTSPYAGYCTLFATGGVPGDCFEVDSQPVTIESERMDANKMVWLEAFMVLTIILLLLGCASENHKYIKVPLPLGFSFGAFLKFSGFSH